MNDYTLTKRLINRRIIDEQLTQLSNPREWNPRISAPEKGKKEKRYNSRFTSNTETVSRVACYLYIKRDVKTRVWNPSFLFILLLLEFLISPPLSFPIRNSPLLRFQHSPPSLDHPMVLSPLPRQPTPPPVADTSRGKELFIGQVSPPVTYVGRNRATPARKRRKYKFSKGWENSNAYKTCRNAHNNKRWPGKPFPVLFMG